jgi:hypothetical protein
LSVPVWSVQISQRTAFLGSLAAGASAGESNSDAACKLEIAQSSHLYRLPVSQL